MHMGLVSCARSLVGSSVAPVSGDSPACDLALFARLFAEGSASGRRRNCHAYAAVGALGKSREFGGPDFARGSASFGENFINDRITDLRQFEAGDPRRSCQ